jgi:hypothetical protein
VCSSDLTVYLTFDSRWNYLSEGVVGVAVIQNHNTRIVLTGTL